MWHEKFTLQFLNGHIAHFWNPVASIETPVCVNTEDTKIITFFKGIRLSLKLHNCGKTNCPAFFLYCQKPWLSPWGPVSIDVTFFCLFLLFVFFVLYSMEFPGQWFQYLSRVLPEQTKSLDGQIQWLCYRSQRRQDKGIQPTPSR